SQVAAFHLGFEVVQRIAFDGRDDRFELLVADRPLPAGLAEPSLDLFAVKRLADSIFFVNIEDRLPDALVGRTLGITMHAAAAAADGKTALAGARIDHFVVVNAAIGATHGFTIQVKSGRQKAEGRMSIARRSCFSAFCGLSSAFYNLAAV